MPLAHMTLHRFALAATLLGAALANAGCDKARAFVHEKTAAAPVAPVVAAADATPAPPPPPPAPPPLPVAAAAPDVPPTPPEPPPRPVRPLEPATVRARLALAEVGIALAEDAVVEEGGTLRVNLEASAATDYDRQLLTQWALCFGTLAPFAREDVRIVNTVGGVPALSVTATRGNIEALAKGEIETADFLAQLHLAKLLPSPVQTAADPAPPRPQHPAPTLHPRPTPARQAPRSMRAPSTYRTR